MGVFQWAGYILPFTVLAAANDELALFGVWDVEFAGGTEALTLEAGILWLEVVLPASPEHGDKRRT